MFTTPLIGALRHAFPDAHLAYVVEPAAAPLVINSPHLDEVIVARRRRGARRLLDDLQLARQLRRGRYDVAIDFHGGPRSAWLARASGASERIGYDIDGRRWMYTRVVHRAREHRPRHSVLNQWDLLEAVPGWPGSAPSPAANPVEMALDANADRRMAERLRSVGVEPSDELILVHVSAGNPFRRWPEPFFVETVARLAEGGPGRCLVLSSGPSDREAAVRIAAAARARLAGTSGRVVDLGEFDLQELRALIGRARLFIGGDTGPLHVAAATPTPVVAIFGPTLAARSAPWRPADAVTIALEPAALPCRPCDQRVCAPGDFRCLTALMPETVVQAAERAL